MIDEKEILLQQERQQRADELRAMRERDDFFGVTRHEITNPLLELNERIKQYVSMFPYSLEFLALQAVGDFSRHYIVMQAKKLDPTKPVLILRDEKHTKIFVNAKVTRQDFKAGGVFYFLREEFV